MHKDIHKKNLQNHSTGASQIAKPVDLQTSIHRIDHYLMAGAMTIQRATEGRSLRSFSKTESPKAVSAVIAAYLLSLAIAYNVNRKIAEDQAVDIAQIILRDYWFLKLAEIALFIDRAKSGRYGTSYGTIDRPTVIRWLDAYCIERDEAIEQEHIEKQRSAGSSPNEIDPRFIETFKHLALLPNRGTLMNPDDEIRMYPKEMQEKVKAERTREAGERDHQVTNSELYADSEKFYQNQNNNQNQSDESKMDNQGN